MLVKHFLFNQQCPFLFGNNRAVEERAGCFTLFSCCRVADCVLCFSFMVLWVGLCSMVVFQV